MRPIRLLFLLLLLPGAPAVSGCDSQQVCTSTDTFATEDLTPEGATLGATAAGGSCVTVNYVARLAATGEVADEGTGFDFSVVADGRGVIPGFALGVNGQRVGQTRRVVIPPDLGYSTTERPARLGTVGGVEGGTPYVGIPSCSTLEFDVTLVRINQDTRLCGQ